MLYFPTYSKLAEVAQPSPAPLVRREVVYLRNLDLGSMVAAQTSPTGLILQGAHGPLASVTSEHMAQNVGQTLRK